MKERNTRHDTWGGVNGLGEELPLYNQVGDIKSDKFVGIFYLLWHPSIFGLSDPGKPRNVHELLVNNPEALHDADAKEWKPTGTFYWGEPLFGYYNLDVDIYVIRKHAQMLSDIGIDTLVIDFTNFRENQLFYTKKTLTVLCDTFLQIRKEGKPTPQIICMTTWDGHFSGHAATVLFEDFYKPGLYDSLWFNWQGKPLIMADKSAVTDKEVLEYFTFRKSHPHYYPPTEKDEWPWLSIIPPSKAFTDENACEEVAIGAAQNWANGPSYTFMSAMDSSNNFIARGRSYHNGKPLLLTNPVSSEYPSAQNYNLRESLDSAIELDPNFLFVTSWNEWIAGRFTVDPFNTGDVLPPCGGFCDAFTAEFSRDIELTLTGGLGDNAYMILAAAIRRFKGLSPLEQVSIPHTIDLAGDFSQWQTVTPEYLDDVGDTYHRDCLDIFNQPIQNNSGRNDFELLKVAFDAEYIYFYAQTVDSITPLCSSGWMQLLLRIGDGSNWEGYQYIIGRKDTSEDFVTLERSLGGWNWEIVSDTIAYRVKENKMHMRIPLNTLGLNPNSINIQFKWADNLQNSGDVFDFYTNGDVAPNGRFNYQFIVG